MQTHTARPARSLAFIGSLGLVGALLLASAGCGTSSGPSETVLLNTLEVVVNAAAGAVELIASQQPGPDAAAASLYTQQLTVAIDASITEFQTTDTLQVKIATALGDFGKVIVPDLPAGPIQVIVATLIPTVETLLKQLSSIQTTVSTAAIKNSAMAVTPHTMSAAGVARLQTLQAKNKVALVRALAVHAAASK
jgi:hypothetical protein